jgi:hypothetical protein
VAGLDLLIEFAELASLFGTCLGLARVVFLPHDSATGFFPWLPHGLSVNQNLYDVVILEGDGRGFCVWGLLS